MQLRRSAALHYTGQAHELVLPVPDGPLDAGATAALAQSFCAEHQRVYGYAEPPERVQLVAVRLRATLTTAKPRYEDIGRHVATVAAESNDAREHATREAYFGPAIGWATTPVLRRQDIGFEAKTGPAIVEELDTTIVVPPGVQFALDRFGSIVLTLHDAAVDSASQPLSLELVTNALDAITDEMAGILTRTARSLGIKDAHDFSIAICTAQGELVSGGVGLAIHLGAIPEAIAAVRERYGDDLHDGDVVIMNDPYHGGMHLPDIFMFMPIFFGRQAACLRGGDLPSHRRRRPRAGRNAVGLHRDLPGGPAHSAAQALRSRQAQQGHARDADQDQRPGAGGIGRSVGAVRRPRQVGKRGLEKLFCSATAPSEVERVHAGDCSTTPSG